MFNYDLYEQKSHLSTPRLPGGVAPSRQSLETQKYLEKKLARLNAEEIERRRIKIERSRAFAITSINRLLNATVRIFRGAKIRLHSLGH